MHLSLITFTLASVIYTSLACSPELDVDYRGISTPNDLYTYPSIASSFQDCCARCTADSRCNAWTWVYSGGYCYLKSSVGYKYLTRGKISGLRSGGSVTTSTRRCSFREYNYAYAYNDITLPLTLNSADECCDRCVKTTTPSKCVAWTYIRTSTTGYCYLKNNRPTSLTRVTYTNAVSGYVD